VADTIFPTSPTLFSSFIVKSLFLYRPSHIMHVFCIVLSIISIFNFSMHVIFSYSAF